MTAKRTPSRAPRAAANGAGKVFAVLAALAGALLFVPVDRARPVRELARWSLEPGVAFLAWARDRGGLLYAKAIESVPPANALRPERAAADDEPARRTAARDEESLR